MAISLRQHRELLADYLRPQRARVAILGVLLLGSIGLQLLVPQIVRHFIDTARSGAAVDTLLGNAVLFLAVALAGQVVSALAVYASENVGWTATNLLRADLALHCLRLDLPFHNARTPGEMIERVDGDVSQLSGFFSQLVIRVRPARWEGALQRHLKPGDFYPLLPPAGDIHRVRTVSEVPSISIHLLGNDLGCIWRHAFDPVARTVSDFRSGYANVECQE